jgi:hypothetical protein
MSHEKGNASVTVSARVARKQADLPRFVILRSADIAHWQLGGTTVVDVSINGVARNRRTVKRWTPEVWFMTITQEDCHTLGIDTGTTIELTLRLSPAGLPAELETLIRSSAAARRSWERLTEAQKRQVREGVASAKQTATRERRARKVLLRRQ